MNLVVIGYGGMGTYHVQQLIAKEENVQVFGVYDIFQERNTKAQEEGLKAYESLEAVLQDAEVDAVLIATPNDCHKDLAIQSLRAGKHVVCEKPVAMNTAELDEILAVAEETGQTFMVHQNRRWDPDFLIIQDIYQNQPIGELFQIESRVQGANGIPGDWRHIEKHGGGMILDWGVHLFDQLLYMIDSPVVNVEVDLSYILGDEVDDGFICYLTFENRMRAIVEVGTTNFTKLPRWYVKGLEGTAKIVDWDLSGEMIMATRDEDVAAPTPIKAGVGYTKTMAPPSEEATEALEFPTVEAKTSFYQNFFEVATEGAEPIVKNQEVRRVMQLIDRIFELAMERKNNSHI